MGSDDLYKKSKELDIYNRKSKKDKRKILDRILIVCEGKQTEPLYFKNFQIDKGRIQVEIEGTGRNTLSLVEKTLDLKLEAIKRKEPYNQIWCVFDKDSFPNENFDNAIKKAEAHKLRLAYSNEAFELWFLLHFEYYNSPISRDDYKEKLTQKLEKIYTKTDINVYKMIEHRQSLAIRNARRLYEDQLIKKIPFSKCNPVTTVFMLVEELNTWR